VGSDARSAQIIDDRIQPALESGSAIGSSRPVLIVIDEIDGATGGSDNVRSNPYVLFCTSIKQIIGPSSLVDSSLDYCNLSKINPKRKV
jgi:hypothetical protein